MPFVNVKILKGATTDQKAQIVSQMTQTLVDVLGKLPERTHIVIDEVDEENWGFAGQLTDDYRKSKHQT